MSKQIQEGSVCNNGGVFCIEPNLPHMHTHTHTQKYCTKYQK